MALTVRQLLTKMGYTNLPSASMYGRVNEWDSWYRGKTSFHKYRVYNGKTTQSCVRKSLRMTKHMAEDKADLLLNEHIAFVVKSGQEALNQVIKDNDFFTKGNQLIEKGQALGTAAFVEYLETDNQGNEKVKIDYIDDPRRIWPLSWEQGSVTECAFVSTSYDRHVGKVLFITLHLLENDVYVVHNHLFTENGQALPLPPGMLAKWTANSPVPTFQIYKPNIVNNFEEDSPLGISLFANAIDTLKIIDTIYDSYFNEFLLGRKRIFVDATILNVDFTPGSDGQVKPVFDPNDAVFYNLPGMESEKGKPIVESNMDLRTEQHKQGLQDTLDLLSEQCGFGKGYYRFDTDSVQTATGVINQNSKLYRKVRKEEIMLRAVLLEVTKGLLLLLGEDPEQEINVIFDDSILEDRSTKIKRSLLEYGQGVIDRVAYFMETRGLSQPAAEAYVREMAAREKDTSLLSPMQLQMSMEPDGEEGDGGDPNLGGEKLENEEGRKERSDSERAYHGRRSQ